MALADAGKLALTSASFSLGVSVERTSGFNEDGKRDPVCRTPPTPEEPRDEAAPAAVACGHRESLKLVDCLLSDGNNPVVLCGSCDLGVAPDGLREDGNIEPVLPIPTLLG